MRDSDHQSSRYELFREGWSPTERRLLFSEKDLLHSLLNIRKTASSHPINVRLVVSFATSPGLRDSDHQSSRYELFCEGWSPTERRLLFSERDLLDSQLNIRKTESSHPINVWLVVSFATSPGLRDSDHRSSSYELFREGWSPTERRLLFSERDLLDSQLKL